MELGECTLLDIFKKRQQLQHYWSEKELIKIFYSLSDALNVSYKYGIYHRDLSLNNIILSKEKDEYKLIDFGEAFCFKQEIEEAYVVGKIPYMAPEVYQQYQNIIQYKFNQIKPIQHFDKADIYSLGIIILNMSILEQINGQDYLQMQSGLRKVQNQYPKLYSILQKVLQTQINIRLNYTQLLQELSSFFQIIENTQIVEINYIPTKNMVNIDKQEANNFLKQAYNNLKCNFFRQAIKNFCQAYQIVQNNNDKQQNELDLFQICINISYCQKKLLNYQKALDMIKIMIQKQSMKVFQIEICHEYADLLYLQGRYIEAYSFISIFLQEIDVKTIQCNLKKQKFKNMIFIQGLILKNLGYYQDAYSILKNLEKDVYGFDLLLLKIQILDIQIQFGILKDTVQNIKELRDKIYTDLQSDQQNLLLLVSLIEMQYFLSTNQILKFKCTIDYVLCQFKNQNYINNLHQEQFIQLYKYKIESLIKFHKYDNAMFKINSVIYQLENQQSQFRQMEILILKAKILRKQLKLQQAEDIIKQVLSLFDIQNFQQQNFKNYNLFRKIHYELGCIHYLQYEFENSLKCFKYTLEIYYSQQNLFIESRKEDLFLIKIYKMLAKINLKICLFDKSEKYLTLAKRQYEQIKDKNNFTIHDFDLQRSFFKLYFQLNNKSFCQIYIQQAQLALENNYGNLQQSVLQKACSLLDQSKYNYSQKFYEVSLNLVKQSYLLFDKCIQNQNDIRRLPFIVHMIKIQLNFDRIQIAQKYIKICQFLVNNQNQPRYFKVMYLKQKALLLQKQKKYNKAIITYKKTLESVNNLYKKFNSFDQISIMIRIGDCFVEANNYQEAVDVYTDCSFSLKNCNFQKEFWLQKILQDKLKKLQKAVQQVQLKIQIV